jgi:hypothetical protein
VLAWGNLQFTHHRQSFTEIKSFLRSNFMATTSHLGLTLVEQAQAQKEVTVNQAFVRIDALLNTGAKSRATNTPPALPASGDLYIVGTSPTGAWAGQAKKLAYFDQIWKFISAGEGMLIWVNDESRSYYYNGTDWLAVVGNDLSALEALSTTGFAARTATDTWATRSITAGNGINVANGNGASGNPIVSFIGGFEDLGDSGIISPANGEIMAYSGGLWRNARGIATLFYNTQSATSYTLVSADAGRTIYCTAATSITLTMPNNFSVGYNCNIIQAGAGQITFTPASGALRRNRQSHTRSAGQWAVCQLQVVGNSGGSAAEYVLSGDTAV